MPGFELAFVGGGLPDPELNLLCALENFENENPSKGGSLNNLVKFER